MKKYILCLVFAILSVSLFAGDVAAFEDIGFSADGKTYLFAEYGITDKDFQGYAEIYAVDIEKNDFLKNGVYKTNPSKATTGKSGSSVYTELKEKHGKWLNSFNATPVSLDDILYIKSNDSKLNTETISVTDFVHSSQENPISYDFTLVPYYEGKGKSLVSSFYIVVEKKNKSGDILEKIVVGNPDVKRKMISNYAIEKIFCTKDAKSFVILVEKISEENGVPTIRYMVETFKLKN